MSEQLWQTSLKIGDLAGQTGLSIRTLYYYDEINFLKPSHHTLAGHRLYTSVDIIRLQQILSLRYYWIFFRRNKKMSGKS